MVGMGRELCEAFPLARQTFEEADQILGFSLSSLAWEGPEEQLNDTINTQPALMMHSVAALRVLGSLHPHLVPAYTAGHSMGELSALVAAGALPFAGALRLARQRGEFMKQAGEANPGGMAAILGLDIPTLDGLCAQASQGSEIVQVANDNCPGQVVISGANSALDRALALAQQAGARRAVRLAVSIAAHSPFMLHAQSGFNQAVADAGLGDPHTPLVGNVTAAPLNNRGQIQADLQDQLTHRVRWTESIQFMIQKGVTIFLELGSGAVLTGLLKRIDKSVEGIAIGLPGDYEKIPS